MDVRAAAQLLAPAADVDNADLIAVLLAEDRRSAAVGGPVDVHYLPGDRHIVQDVSIDRRVHLFELLAGEAARIVEVEASDVRRDQRALLLGALARARP